MTPFDPIALAAQVAVILEDLGIRYVIGGSVASSIIGEPRSTLDIDMMIEVDETRVRALTLRLRDDFYVDELDAVDSVRHGLSFNAIHYATSTKVDFFPAERFATRQLDRRRGLRIRNDLPILYFYSAEDLIIRKLMWFRSGNETSSRQWRDVVGILKTAGSTLDKPYLTVAAAERSLSDLLIRAAADAGFEFL